MVLNIDHTQTEIVQHLEASARFRLGCYKCIGLVVVDRGLGEPLRLGYKEE